MQGENIRKPNTYLGRSETFCRGYQTAICCRKVTRHERKLTWGDASQRRHCQLENRCPKQAMLEVWIFMYLVLDNTHAKHTHVSLSPKRLG